MGLGGRGVLEGLSVGLGGREGVGEADSVGLGLGVAEGLSVGLLVGV